MSEGGAKRAGEHEGLHRRAGDRRARLFAHEIANLLGRRDDGVDTISVGHLQRLASRVGEDDGASGRQRMRGHGKTPAAARPEKIEHAAAHPEGVAQLMGLRHNSVITCGAEP
jgi:hypothetical protein